MEEAHLDNTNAPVNKRFHPAAMFVGLAAMGAGVWILAGKLSGTGEAFDSQAYWLIGVPLMIVTAFIAGRVSPRRSWAWGIALVIPQPLILALSNDLTKAPLRGVGIVLFAFVLWVCVLASMLAAARSPSGGPGR